MTDDAPPTAVVTGGSTGIGAAVCEMFLERGYRVISLDRASPTAHHPNLLAYEVDLADVRATRAVCGVLREFRATTIVHNAGVIRAAALEHVSLEDVAHLVDLHLSATILLTQACVAAMRRARFGRVVMIASRAITGLAGRTAYAATKAGLLGIARTWALELGPDGVTVNVVAPGPILTRMFSDVVTSDEARTRLAESLPLRRLGTPHDVARAVMYFADPENGFVTGQTLFVCGGSSVGSLAI
jgi:NAD(P)-dependent dehydrogenase (short-subunit alcohol dehydrogenase family)